MPLTNQDQTQWPEGFLENTFGSFEDSPLERLPQGTYEDQDEILTSLNAEAQSTESN